MNSRSRNKQRISFFISAAVIALLLSVFLVLGNMYLIRSHREEERRRTAVLVGFLSEKLPELSETEILNLVKHGGDEVNERSEIYRRGNALLEKYGYDTAYFSGKENVLFTGLLCFNGGILILTAGFAVLFIWLRETRVRREVRQLQNYFEDLNRGIYDLKMEESAEGELSLLQSDIFKVTQQLRTAAEESREKSEELSKWLADISHQLKTPIASIRINLDNLLDDPDMPPELQRMFLKECSMQLEWISSLVQTLLKLARIDAGTVELKKESMDLKAVACEAVKKLGILSEIREVEIVWEDEPQGTEISAGDLPEAPMTGDAAWQLEAVSNILKNCIEHSVPGQKVYLSIRSTTVFKELTIRDTGEGISEEDLPHIFERFYRAKNAGKESVGIGLSLAASIVEAGGGKVIARSEQGKGSTFTLRYLL